MKLAVAVPSNDTVHADFAMSLVCAVSATMAHSIKGGQTSLLAVNNEKNCNIPQGRCNLVEAARKLNAEAIVFIDSDQMFPRDTIIRLDAHDKDIVGCNIISRRTPYRSNVEDMKGNRLEGKMRRGLEEVSRIGTGILYVRMDVFEELSKPYFNFGYDEAKGWTGEDFGFCNAARARGFKIYVDHDLSKEVYHQGVFNYHIEMLEGGKHGR